MSIPQGDINQSNSEFLEKTRNELELEARFSRLKFNNITNQKVKAPNH